MNPVRTAARAMLAGIFVASGARNLAHPDLQLANASRITSRVGPQLTKIHPRLPADDRTLLRIHSVVQVVGGVLLTTRLRRAAAVLLAGTLIPSTLAAHSFWQHEDPAQRRQQTNQFLKNVSIFGGLMLAVVDTEGRPGLRWRANHMIKDTNRTVQHGVRHTQSTVRHGVHHTRGKAKAAVAAANRGRRRPS